MTRCVPPPVLAVLAVLAALLMPTPAQAATPESRYGTKAVRATNNARAAADLRELRSTTASSASRVRQAKAMAAQEEMYHQDLGPIMDECGLSTVGENVAYGYSTGRAVVWQGWMLSEGHRANILNRDFRLVAVAGRRSDDGTWYAAQVFGSKA